MGPSSPDDPYAHVNYRRVIAWPARIQREAPLLTEVFGSVPAERRGRGVLDLGCGTGEHSRFLFASGFAVTGVDSSPAQLATAREGEGGPDFVLGELPAIGGLVPEGFGGALCLGNTLPHLETEEALRGFLAGLASRLLPGAPFLLQLLNYDRILSRGERTLPTNVRPGDAPGEEIVLVRLMTPGEEGRVVFTPATFVYRPHGTPPLELVACRNVLLRGWRRAELEGQLDAAGLSVESRMGGMRREPWDEASPDLVLLCRRSGG